MTTLPTIKLKTLIHKGNKVAQILFNKNEELTALLRSAIPMRWSKTMSCWYSPYYKNIYQDLFVLGKNAFYLDYPELIPKVLEMHPVEDIKKKTTDCVMPENKLAGLSTESNHKIEEYKRWLNSKRYSQNTITTYTDALKTFLRFFAHKLLSEITNDDLIIFNNEYILAKKLSASFQNQVVNAIKLFFKTVENKKIDIASVHRPKRAKVLPNVLSKEEVKLILSAPGNIKHRAMLSLIYSCGLRCGELLKLKPEHIDSKRGLVLVKQGKGRKDRVVPLSQKILELLRNYYKAARPVNWLFEGQVKGNMYDERSLQKVLKHSVGKAGITKPVTLHWLRHSYATHLLENGTDLRYIQELLGHSRSTTTEIYTHVSNKQLQKIISPFDTL